MNGIIKNSGSIGEATYKSPSESKQNQNMRKRRLKNQKKNKNKNKPFTTRSLTNQE